MAHQPDACFATPATTNGGVAALVLSPNCERPVPTRRVAGDAKRVQCSAGRTAARAGWKRDGIRPVDRVRLRIEGSTTARRQQQAGPGQCSPLAGWPASHIGCSDVFRTYRAWVLAVIATPAQLGGIS
jgi:hypothetical protein